MQFLWQKKRMKKGDMTLNEDKEKREDNPLAMASNVLN